MHTAARDAFVRESGIHSVIAAPLIHREVVVGAITVYSTRPDAFDATGAGLLNALADQAAVAIANAGLILELEQSRAEVARRADSEQTLREIAARVSAILDPAEVLQQIVEEVDPPARIGRRPDRPVRPRRSTRCAGRTPRATRWRVMPEWARTGGLKSGQAVAGRPFKEQRAVRTDDYLADDRFERDDAARAFVERTGIRVRDRRPAGGRCRSARARSRSCRASRAPTTRPTSRS